MHPSQLIVPTGGFLTAEQCTNTHQIGPTATTICCVPLTNPTAKFGAGRHSPNVQLHVTPVEVFLVIVLVTRCNRP